jgi:hypothetical protein
MVIPACKELGDSARIMFSEENDIIMKLRAEHFACPLLAVLTLAIGVGFVRAAEAVVSFIDRAVMSREQPPEENIGVISTENYKSLSTQQPTHGRVLACYDPNILPIWHELKRDEVFKATLTDAHGVMNCSDMIEISKVHLNGDTEPELVVRGKGNLCAASGNCGYWVFEKRGSQLRKLVSSWKGNNSFR